MTASEGGGARPAEATAETRGADEKQRRRPTTAMFPSRTSSSSQIEHSKPLPASQPTPPLTYHTTIPCHRPPSLVLSFLLLCLYLLLLAIEIQINDWDFKPVSISLLSPI
ncbi:unnamed protein product [Cuscuta epithymum]|uniref:Uncharacterized protein n=1 Tax=Cuscuta epithymum TaxID=186058 RepID=A0AAV0EY89_9ASTE|nr:unnamed protein product [Cuscuta epithymum]